MMEILETETYKKWFASLKDRTARMRINLRIRRLSLGNPGDTKSVGEGIFELRINYGPGYRVYFLRKKKQIIVLLAGGDKSTQKRDIEKAK